MELQTNMKPVPTDEHAAPSPRSKEIQETGLNGTRCESAPANRIRMWVDKCPTQIMLNVARMTRHASVGNGPRDGRKKGWTHVQPPSQIESARGV